MRNCLRSLTKRLRSIIARRHSALIQYALVTAGIFCASIAITTSTYAVNPDGSYNVWPAGSVPTTVNQQDSAGVELGMKFSTTHSGWVQGVRFYKGSQNTGTHRGSLWSSNGTRLASATFVNETASGWQTVTFAQPVLVQPNTVYVVSYYAPNGHFSINNGALTTDITSGPLKVPKNSAAAPNDVYAYGSTSRFPSNPSSADNYWVDVVFRARPSAPSITTASANGKVTVNWNQPVSYNSLASYQILRNGAVIKTVPTGTYSYVDTAVQTGTSYTYAVRAVDAYGSQSVDSNTIATTVVGYNSVKAFDSANTISDPAWFVQAYNAGFRLYVLHTTSWGSCAIWPQAQQQIANALAAGLKVAAYTRDPNCWQNGILAAGPYKGQLQFFALDSETDPGVPVTRAMVDGIKAMGVRPVIYTGSGMWSSVQGATANSFSDVPLWDTNTSQFNYATWQPNLLSPTPVVYGGWNTPQTMRVGVQQQFEYTFNGVNIDLNSFNASFLR